MTTIRPKTTPLTSQHKQESQRQKATTESSVTTQTATSTAKNVRYKPDGTVEYVDLNDPNFIPFEALSDTLWYLYNPKTGSEAFVPVVNGKPLPYKWVTPEEKVSTMEARINELLGTQDSGNIATAVVDQAGMATAATKFSPSKDPKDLLAYWLAAYAVARPEDSKTLGWQTSNDKIQDNQNTLLLHSKQARILLKDIQEARKTGDTHKIKQLTQALDQTALSVEDTARSQETFFKGQRNAGKAVTAAALTVLAPTVAVKSLTGTAATTAVASTGVSYANNLSDNESQNPGLDAIKEGLKDGTITLAGGLILKGLIKTGKGVANANMPETILALKSAPQSTATANTGISTTTTTTEDIIEGSSTLVQKPPSVSKGPNPKGTADVLSFKKPAKPQLPTTPEPSPVQNKLPAENELLATGTDGKSISIQNSPSVQQEAHKNVLSIENPFAKSSLSPGQIKISSGQPVELMQFPVVQNAAAKFEQNAQQLKSKLEQLKLSQERLEQDLEVVAQQMKLPASNRAVLGQQKAAILKDIKTCTKELEATHKALQDTERVLKSIKQPEAINPYVSEKYPYATTPENCAVPAVKRGDLLKNYNPDEWTQSSAINPSTNQRVTISAQQNLTEHSGKHAYEFADPTLPKDYQIKDPTNATEYKNVVHRFFDNPPPGTEMRVSQSGNIYYYNKNLNIFGLVSAEGSPRTLFRPSYPITDPYQYFLKQN